MRVCPTCKMIHCEAIGHCDGNGGIKTEVKEAAKQARLDLRDWLNGRATMSPVLVQNSINAIAAVDTATAFEFQVALTEMLWRRLSETADRSRALANSIKELLEN